MEIELTKARLAIGVNVIACGRTRNLCASHLCLDCHVVTIDLNLAMLEALGNRYYLRDYDGRHV